MGNGHSGTISQLESTFNVSADGFLCHEAATESSNSVLADMVAGIFIFTAFFLAAGTVQGVIGIPVGAPAPYPSSVSLCCAVEVAP